MCYFQFQCVKYYFIITAFISLIIVYYISKHILAIINMHNADELSDDEVYFGKLTLKELKKHILWDKQQSVSAINSPNNSGNNESFKILQAHSQPNLIPKAENSTLDLTELNDSGWDMKGNDDSFIKMENMVAKLCLSPRCSGNTGELNNTLEVIEYILNNPPSSTKEKDERADDLPLKTTLKKEPTVSDLSPKKMIREVKKHEAHNSAVHPQNTPLNTAHQLHKYTESCGTPRDIKQKLLFKTPSQPPTLKKPSTLKKTPSRSNAYQHISSPVASYIKNCPIAPLVKDVHPKKPLPGTSSIPKFVKNLPPAKPSNKENINLPSIAYKSAKKTRVIHVPDEQKLPQSHWIKKVTTTLPKPLVMKHDHRELNCAKKFPQQEDSFADLSYHQAEVSVCTQKSAFKAKKNI